MRRLIKSCVVLVLNPLAEQLQLLQELGLGNATSLFLFQQFFQLLGYLVEECWILVLAGDDGLLQLILHHQGATTRARQLL
ncbi:hypothetical protein D3C76_1435210 [compost metagenome]